MNIMMQPNGTLEEAAQDEASKASRRRLAAELGPGLKRAGEVLHVVGHIVGPGRITGASPFGNGDDGVVELGYVTQAAAEIVQGAVHLLELNHPYPAAALVRQLVEIEYLVWSFSARPESWGQWLRSTGEERKKLWQPRHLREASGDLFDVKEYQSHCEIGGHPTPVGIRALVGDAIDRRVGNELIWWEICQHGTRIWRRVLEGTEAHDVLTESMPVDLDAALGDWTEVDALTPLLRP